MVARTIGIEQCRAFTARALLCAALGVAAWGARAEAQRVGADRDPVTPAADSTRAARVPQWLVPLASLVVPGSGQLLLGESRGLAYFAVDAYAIIEYRAQVTEARRRRNGYKALADEVARRFFGNPGASRSFEYYEAMRGYVESGAFDRIPGGDVDPEVDERTFNGSIWKLARDTYWSDPDVAPPPESAAYTNAVSLYLRRAVPTDFRWSWRNAALEHDQYRRTIKRSNDAFRRARDQLGLLLANRMLSMADALATIRVHAPSLAAPSTWGVEVTLPWPGAFGGRRAVAGTPSGASMAGHFD